MYLLRILRWKICMVICVLEAVKIRKNDGVGYHKKNRASKKRDSYCFISCLSQTTLQSIVG